MNDADDARRPRGLLLEHVSVRYPGAPGAAVADVSFTLPRGRTLAVLGPSGCGKSTLLRFVAGLQRGSGRVFFGEHDMTRVPTHKRDFALMFQDGQLFGHLDVAANVGYALARRRVPRRDIERRVSELLGLVGLSGYENRTPATLSGGQQQRVALARALAAKPRLLLLDEPLSALDRSLRERLAGDLRSVLTVEGTTALLVTHDHDEALTVADDMAIMDAGRIVQHGEATTVWRSPATPQVAEFLGYTTLLTAGEAAAFGLERVPWAVRRSGVRVYPSSDEHVSEHLGHSARTTRRDAPQVRGRVERVAAAGEMFHVAVRVDSLGGRRLDAVAPADQGAQAPNVGDIVGVSVDPSAGVAFH